MKPADRMTAATAGMGPLRRLARLCPITESSDPPQVFHQTSLLRIAEAQLELRIVVISPEGSGAFMRRHSAKDAA